MLPARELIMDGELVSLDDCGRPNFSQLQADISTGRQSRMQLYAFDLLYLDGFDFRRAPLIERKRVLQSLLLEAQPRGILFSEHFEADGEAMYQGACQNRLEGIIAKRADSVYKSKRSEVWLKIKCVMTGEYVIVGYVPGGIGGLGALRIARKDSGHPTYAGKTGTGFTVKSAPGARSMRPEWVRQIRDECVDQGVAFHFKQWGGVNKKLFGRVLDGRTWDELPRSRKNSHSRRTKLNRIQGVERASKRSAR